MLNLIITDTQYFQINKNLIFICLKINNLFDVKNNLLKQKIILKNRFNDFIER